VACDIPSDIALTIVAAAPLGSSPCNKPTCGRCWSLKLNRKRGSFSSELPVRTNLGCPTSRSFFARCGIPLRSTRKHSAHYQHLRFRSVVSHISQKTSEMWGTRRLVVGRELLSRGLKLSGADVLLRSIVRRKLTLRMQRLEKADQSRYFCWRQILSIRGHVSAAL
jgi:hypothetical protein